MIPHDLTEENYFSPENERKYMGSSQFKRFMACEDAALASLMGNIREEQTDALIIGSYVDAHFSGTLDVFMAKHPEIFMKSGGLKAQYRHADYMIQRAERDPLFMKYMSGEKQVIMTGEIAGTPFKIKTDSFHPGKCIVDLKCVKDFRSIWDESSHSRKHFIDYWGYPLQGAVYQEIVRQNTGQKLPFFIAAVTKEKEPDIQVYRIPDEVLADRLSEVITLIPRFRQIKEGKLVPQRCGECRWCRFTKVLTSPVDYREEMEVYDVSE